MSETSEASALPSAPERRSITPAPEDYRERPSLARLLWPVVGLGLTVLLLVAVQARGWPAFEGHGDADAHEHDAHR